MSVNYECRDEVALVHLDRPHRLNAVVPDLVEGLIAALGQARHEARVVVLAGRGRAFCAGHDLKEPTPSETPVQTAVRVDRIQDVTRAVRAFPGIVIAAVHGHALGAGCEFALACDLVVADTTARFGFPEVGVGLSVTGGVSCLLPKLLGPARAKELLLLGEPLSAEQAHALGLVNRVAPAGEHERLAVALAQQIRSRPPTSAALAKRVIDLGLDATLDQALATERDHAVLTAVSGEAEGPRASFVAR